MGGGLRLGVGTGRERLAEALCALAACDKVPPERGPATSLNTKGTAKAAVLS